MKLGRIARTVLTRAVLGMLVAGFAPTPLLALPDGGQVTGGSVAIGHAGAKLTVTQSSDRAAINWQGFGIAPHEAVRFYQPSTSSITLNRVLGQNPSEIFGSLSANGQVFLLNPNGILFAPGAQVDVSGLVGSTLNLSDADFFAGRYTFTKGAIAGAVVNKGAITVAKGGYVALLGPQVRNDGIVSAQLGAVVLAAGNRVTLNLNGNSLVSFAVEQGALDALAENSQVIRAEGGLVILSATAADDLARSVVNNSGIIEATTISNVNGVLRLEGGSITNSGRLAATGGGSIALEARQDVTLASTSDIAASGTRGGTVSIRAEGGTLLADGRIEAQGTDATGGAVELLGTRVGLVNRAQVDTTGRTGGGSVLVGGDYQGRNPGVQNAQRTHVAADATIRADAVETGNGGKIIVWADDQTRYFGAVSARGGSQSGNGGLVETSGKRFLDVNGSTVDTRAAHGSAGTWLLDPTDIQVVAAGSNASAAQVDQFADPDQGGAGNSKIAPATLNAAGANVVLQAQNDITVIDAINLTTTANANLTLQAGRSIAVNSSVATNGSGNITMVANNTDNSVTDAAGAALTGSGGTNRGAGAAALTVAGTVSTGSGGNIKLVNSNASANGGVTGALTVGSAIATADRVTSGNTGAMILTAGGAIALNANVTTGNASAADAAGNQAPRSGNITLSAGTDVTGSGRLTTGNASLSGANAAGTDVATSGNIFVTAGAAGTSGGIELSAVNALTVGSAARNTAVGDTATAGGISLISRNEINNGSPATPLGVALGLAAGATTNTQGTVSASTSTAAGNVWLAASGPLRFGASSVAGSLAASSAGAMTQAGAITVAGSSSFNAGANAITLTTSTNNFTGAVSLNNSGANNVALTDSNGLVLGTSSVGSGTLAITAGGAISQTGALTRSGTGATTLTATAAASDILLNTQANDFGGGAVSVGGTLGNVRDFALRNVNATAPVPTLSGLTNLRHLTLQFDNAAIALPSLTTTAAGNVQVTAGGAITQTARVVVAGTSTFDAGANAITLTTSTNNFTGAVSLNNSGANNIAVTDANALVLGMSNVGTGTLTVTATGANSITQTGVIRQADNAGLARFTTGGGLITLTQANDFTGPVSATNTGANAIRLTDANALQLGTVNTANNLIANAAEITQDAGGLTVGGSSSFNAGANAITLTTSTNNFTGAVSLNNSGANNVALTDSNGLVLGTSSVGSGTLAITAGGAISQTGAITKSGAGATTLTVTAAASDILLNTQANDFGGGAVSVGGTLGNVRDFALRNVNATAPVPTLSGLTNLRHLTLQFDNAAIALPSLTTTAAGNARVTAGGTITQTAAITVAGTSTFDAGANAITLTTSTNNFTGAVSLNNSGANNVEVTDVNALVLGTSNVGTGTLTVTATGANSITQTGVIRQAGSAGLASFTTGGGLITLTQANDFTGPVSATNTGANAIRLTDANALQLGAINTANSLILTAAGSVTQTGPVTASTLSASLSGALSSLDLGSASNNVTNIGAITAPAGFTLANGNNPTALTAAVNTSGNNGAVAISTGTGGYTHNNFDITAGSGAITITADAVAIAANTGTNSFQTTGVLTLKPSSAARAMSLAGAGAFDLSAVEVTNLAGGVTGGGSIVIGDPAASTGALTIGGAVNFGARNVTLNAGSFTDANTTGRTITAQGLNLNARSAGLGIGAAGGNNAIDVATANLSFNTVNGGAFINATGAVNLGPGASSVGAGAITLTAAGAINQTGAITQAADGGAVRFSSGANAITLTHPSNNFSGAVALINSGNNPVQVSDIDDIVLGTSTVGGTLAVNAGATIAQSGALALSGGAATFTSSGGGAVTLSSITGGGQNVSVNTSGLTTIAGTISGIGTLTTDAPGSVSLVGPIGAASLSINETAASACGSLGSGGSISFAGAVTLCGDTSLNATSANFGSTIDSSSGNRHALVANLGGAFVSGAIGQTDRLSALTVTGATTITTGSIRTAGGPAQAGGNVLLSGSGALLTAAIDASGGDAPSGAAGAGGNVTLSGGDVSVATITTDGGSSSNGAGGSAGTIALNATDGTPAISLGGDLNSRGGSGQNNSGGDGKSIEFTAPVIAMADFRIGAHGGSGTTQGASGNAGSIATISAAGRVLTLDLGTGNASFANAANDFGTVAISSADNVVLRDQGAIVLGASDVAGNMTVTAGGLIAQSGALSISGDATFDTSADASIGSVTVAANSPITVGDSNVGGNLGVQTSAGDVVVPAGTDTTVAGMVDIEAGGSVIVDGSLHSGGLSSLRSPGATTITLAADTDISTLILPAAGAISIKLSNAGTAAGAPITAQAISLTDSANSFGGRLTVNTAMAGGSTAAGSYDLTQSAGLTLGAGQTLHITDAGGTAGKRGNVNLSNVANDFHSLAFTGGDLHVRDSNALMLGTIAANTGNTSSGTVLVQSGGNLTLGGAVTAAGTGAALTLVTGANLDNSGAHALSAPAGRWLVYSSSPASDIRGGLEAAYDFKHYGLDYTGAYGGPGSGNGLIYRLAPTITPTLGGSASRLYDGTLTAPIAGLIAVPSAGVMDVDTVTLNAASASYDTRHAGTNKLVTTNDIAIATASNAGRPVYGYTSAPTAAANVGTITAAPLTITAQSDARVYDGTTGSSVAPLVSGTLYDPVAIAASQTFDTRHAGTGKILTPSGLIVDDGNGGANYAVTYVNDTSGTITAAPLVGTADDKNRPVSLPNPPFTASYAGFVPGEGLADLIGTLVFTTPATVASLPGAYAITPSGQTALNYAITYVDGTLTVVPDSPVAPPVVPDPPVAPPVPPVIPPAAGVAYQDALASSQHQPSDDQAGEPVSRGPLYEVKGTGIRLPIDFMQ